MVAFFIAKNSTSWGASYACLALAVTGHCFFFFSHMWILNIDDDSDDRELFCDALKDIDPTIRCVAKDNAEAAINLLSTVTNLPHYIFLDINMPIMGGIECLKLIRKNNRWANIPIIVLSTTGNHREIEEVKRLGADFLAKETMYHKYVSKLKSKIERSL